MSTAQADCVPLPERNQFALSNTTILSNNIKVLSVNAEVQYVKEWVRFTDYRKINSLCNPMEVEQKHWISPKETEKLIIFSEEDGNSFLLMSHSSYCGHTIAYEDPSQQVGEAWKIIS